MNWITGIREPYQESGAGRGHAYYYVYRVSSGNWRAGRYWLSRDVDFRLQFSSAKVARAYCQQYDNEIVIIEAVTA